MRNQEVLQIFLEMSFIMPIIFNSAATRVVLYFFKPESLEYSIPWSPKLNSLYLYSVFCCCIK